MRGRQRVSLVGLPLRECALRIGTFVITAKQRDVVRLIHLDGWTVEQTAELLELPVGTVKSRSFRAHRRLGMALAHLRVPAAS